MIEWAMEMGLQLVRHKPTETAYSLIRLSQMLSMQKPQSVIRVFSDGAYDAMANTPLIDKLTLTPTQLRLKYGIGKSSAYIEGEQSNGVKNTIAMQLTFSKNRVISTTPFLQELIEIAIGSQNIHLIMCHN